MIKELLKLILENIKKQFNLSVETPMADKATIRKRAMSLASNEKVIRLATGRVQQPYGYVLSVLINLVTLSGYIKNRFGYIVEEEESLFDQNCRDFKVLVGRFDRLIADHLQYKMENGLDFSDLDKVRAELDYAFRNMLTDDWYNWLKGSQDKIGQHILLLRQLAINGGEAESQMIAFLVQQALTSGPINEVLEIDEQPPDEFME